MIIINKSEVIRTPTDDFGDRHTNQLILRSLFLVVFLVNYHSKKINIFLYKTTLF